MRNEPMRRNDLPETCFSILPSSGQLMFVLACTMAQRTGDERFYPPARQAAGRFAALQKQMGGHTDVYAVDNHSCVINAAMEELAKPERSVEPKAVKKNTPER